MIKYYLCALLLLAINVIRAMDQESYLKANNFKTRSELAGTVRRFPMQNHKSLLNRYMFLYTPDTSQPTTILRIFVASELDKEPCV